MAANGHQDATYVGDGLYASHDHYHIWISTERENGIHSVALEPAVFREMLRFVRSMETKHGAPGYWTGGNLKRRKADT
jgi:hypothetical protein